MALSADDKLLVAEMIKQATEPLAKSINDLAICTTKLLERVEGKQEVKSGMPSMSELFQFQMMSKMLH